MRKILLALALVSVFAFAGCQQQEEETTPATEETPAVEEVTPVTPEAETPATTEEAAE